jgi:hypothetical protein
MIVRHGMTMGELALLFNEAFGIRLRSRSDSHAGLETHDVGSAMETRLGATLAERSQLLLGAHVPGIRPI